MKSKGEMIVVMRKMLEAKLNMIKHDINELKSEATNQGKSSAGDKHEVGGEMANAQLIQLERNVGLIQAQMAQIDQLTELALETIGLGSVVETNRGTYFISEALGLVKDCSEQWIALSQHSPLAQALIHSSERSFSFRGLDYEIIRIR